MAHFAQIDSSNIVTQVIVLNNSDAPNEEAGISFCQALFGASTNWVQTSYNDNIRFRYASTGMKYDSSNDVFYPQQPYPSWTLNTTLWAWEPPVAMPDDAGWDSEDNPTEWVAYDWDEDSTSCANRTVTALSGE
jgi:hypothetical protein